MALDLEQSLERLRLLLASPQNPAAVPGSVVLACEVARNILGELQRLRAENATLLRYFTDARLDSDVLALAEDVGRRQAIREAIPASPPFTADQYAEFFLPEVGKPCVLQFASGRRVALVLVHIMRHGNSQAGTVRDEFLLSTPSTALPPAAS